MLKNIFSSIDTNFLKSDIEISHAIKVMRAKVAAYILDNQLQSLVLGISGGVDSAFAAALLRPVCDYTNTRLVGRSITIETNTQEEIERSIAVGSHFCHDFAHLDYTALYLQHKEQLPEINGEMLSKLRMGNYKATLRMICLYDLAQLYRGIVISTDNYTEYLTGFWTLHGDVGDYAPFLHLWKTEVYHAARFLCKQLTKQQSAILTACINAVPTDGLGISRSDLEQLDVETYEDADKILSSYLAGDAEYENHSLIKRFIASDYKRKIPLNISRYSLCQQK
jgi:NAD+ synthetase